MSYHDTKDQGGEMKTVKQLKDILGLNTVHQVRNRIESINEVISEHIKRGENNEVLVSDRGVQLLTRLQDLYESGLLLSEAAEIVMSENSYSGQDDLQPDLEGIEKNRTTPSESELTEHLRQEVRFFRELLESSLTGREKGESPMPESDGWWTAWLGSSK